MFRRTLLAAALCTAVLNVQAASLPNQSKGNDMLVRLAEIEVFPQQLPVYLQLAEEVARMSLVREPGVVCLFPTHVKGKPETIRILEVYKSQQAYAAHLNTAHFLKYKTQTAHMVKDLKLIDLESLDPATMPAIFKKMH